MFCYLSMVSTIYFLAWLWNSCSRQLEFWACSNTLWHNWCTVVLLLDGKFLLGAGAILSLCKCFLSQWKIVVEGSRKLELGQTMLGTHFWGRWNFELVNFFLKIWLEIILLGTHGVHCGFSFMIENSFLRQVEFWACATMLENYLGDCFVTHA